MGEPVSQWSCHSLCWGGTERGAVAQADFVDLSESDLSWRLAVCCLLSVTFPNTTAYFPAVTADEKTWGKKKRQANTLSRVHQSTWASAVFLAAPQNSKGQILMLLHSFQLHIDADVQVYRKKSTQDWHQSTGIPTSCSRKHQMLFEKLSHLIWDTHRREKMIN